MRNLYDSKHLLRRRIRHNDEKKRARICPRPKNRRIVQENKSRENHVTTFPPYWYSMPYFSASAVTTMP